MGSLEPDLTESVGGSFGLCSWKLQEEHLSLPLRVPGGRWHSLAMARSLRSLLLWSHCLLSGKSPSAPSYHDTWDVI